MLLKLISMIWNKYRSHSETEQSLVTSSIDLSTDSIAKSINNIHYISHTVAK